MSGKREPERLGRGRERERERESFIRNNLHNGVVSGAAFGERERFITRNNVHACHTERERERFIRKQCP